MSEQPATEWAASIDGLAMIHVSGQEAGTFLQGQLSNDVSTLATGGAQLTSWNNARGRVYAVLALVRRAEEHFTLLCPRDEAANLANRLRMYVLRAKAQIELDEGAAPIALGGAGALEQVGLASEAPPAAWPSAVLPGTPDTVAVRWPDAAAPRCLVVGQVPDAITAALTAQPEELWWNREVSAAVPWITDEVTREQFVAQMLNLDRLGAISFDKGCYTGQEVVARTHYLGRIKRRMYRFCVAGEAPVPGDELVKDSQSDGATAAGTVVNVASDGDLLAVVQCEHANAALRLVRTGQPLAAQPLPYEL